MNATVRKIREFEVFDAHESERVTALRQMIDALRSFRSNDDRAPFSEFVRYAQSLLELDDAELSGRLRVSRPTIGRWVRGQSAPHPLGQSAVIQTLADLAMQKLKRHQTSARSLAEVVG